MDNRKRDIIKSLNENYGKDFLVLENCKKFKEKQEQELRRLQTEVCFIEYQIQIN